MDSLADDNKADVEATLTAVQETKRRAGRPIELKRRDGASASSEQDATPVPPIAVPAPGLPALPPPNSEQDRNAAPSSQPADSSPAQNFQARNPDQK